MVGAKNKVENIAKAYTFLDKERYPNLDSDSCDGVLMAMMARHVASILLGFREEVPPPILLRYTNAAKKVKGAGRNAKVVTEGMLHRPEYWYAYEPKVYGMQLRDAREKTRTLQRTQAVI
jgi:hypothetical protein